MNFGEKLKKLRKANHMTQGQLAKIIGVTQRTVAAYEAGESYPRYKKIYEDLADALNTTVDFLRTENEEFMEEVGTLYGTRGQRQAAVLTNCVKELFAGGELSDEDEIAFLTEIQQLYLDSKKRAKKFTPKKYLEDKE